MPKRPDIRKVLIIGSGPIVIGQACEFDYSGTQACKALRQLGYEIVLVNSNPATIMTDPVMADETYIEPLNLETLTEIIATARPDALLPNLGGQSGLNLSSELYRAGVLAEYGVTIIGVSPDAIERGEDRLAFKETMTRLGVEMPRSEICYSVDEAVAVAAELGYPVVIRPAYTMGGTGGGIVYNREELQVVVERGIRASLVGQVLVEESVLGWEELELEVVRDAKNQMITVCFIENVDAMGVHTGDSFCTAPMLTIAPELQDKLQRYSYAIVEAIEVIGGTNIQFAHDPETGPGGRHRDQPPHLALLGPGLQGHRLSHRHGELHVGRGPDVGRDPLLARRHAGEVHAVRRLRGGQVRPLGLREVPRRPGPAGDADAGGGRGDVHRQELQGIAAKSHPFPRDRAVMGSASPRTSTPARWRSSWPCSLSPPASGTSSCTKRCARAPTTEALYARTYIKPWFIEQMRELVQLEEEILRLPGTAGSAAGAGPPKSRASRRAADTGQEGRLRRRLSGETPRRPREPDPRAARWRWASRTATTPCRSAE